MNGIIVVNKKKGCTSRDVVNQVSKILKTKKVGHIGTLDPLAEGVLVLCVGKALKMVQMLVQHDKEYIAGIKLGIETDTLDITGNILKKEAVKKYTNEEIKEVLKKYLGSIVQEVPKYSAIKVNGKKLYEYARKGEEVVLPKREVYISELELISDNVDNEFFIKCSVSSGTYIRSLIRDIGNSLGTIATMTSLTRTRVGNFSILDSYTIDDIEEGKYKILKIDEVIDLPKVIVDYELEKKVRNGCVLEKFFDDEMVFLYNKDNVLLAIYQKKDEYLTKPYRMFV